MNQRYILPLFLLLTSLVYSQELIVNEKLINPTKSINDGIIELDVSGGTPPYTYKWSNQNTSLDSNRSENLTEGVEYSVVVTDASGNSIEKSYEVSAESITERFNGSFTPLVGVVSKILFWDPFAAIGLHDPVIYAEHLNVYDSRWEPGIEGVFVLEQWLKADGEKVKGGEPIAIVRKNNESDEIIALTSGTLRHKEKVGAVIYDSSNSEHVIQTGAHVFAHIEYDEKIPILYPNGDPQKTNIPFIVIWLGVGALFFTFRMGFINLRGFKHSIQLAKGKYSDPNAPGELTHFQALSTAVSATVGLGNIAGVAVAVSIGGAGATFWMIVAGFLGMSSKFVECTLGVKYRDISPDGRVFGGPMSYLEKGLAKQNKRKLGKILAIIFAILCVGGSLGGGNMFQANQSFEALAGQMPILEGNGFWFGMIMAIIVAAVILGGIKSIAKVTEKIVPFMAILYVLASLTVIFVNIDYVGEAFRAIYNGAFNPSALKGGVLGVLIVGFQRAAFSNEAGVGSAAIAHSAVKTNHPVSEGFVALVEPFIDTILICTLTALVIIFSGNHEVIGMGGVQLTSDSFATVISWFPTVLAFAIFLFAFSTMISWSYYGMRAWTYLFGKSKKMETLYKLMFLFFVVLGSSISLGAVLDFSDMMILAMAFPNIIGLYFMTGEVRKDLKEYLRKLRAGELYDASAAKSDENE